MGPVWQNSPKSPNITALRRRPLPAPAVWFSFRQHHTNAEDAKSSTPRNKFVNVDFFVGENNTATDTGINNISPRSHKSPTNITALQTEPQKRRCGIIKQVSGYSTLPDGTAGQKQYHIYSNKQMVFDGKLSEVSSSVPLNRKVHLVWLWPWPLTFGPPIRISSSMSLTARKLQTHYRSYRGLFLQVIWPNHWNQQCQSTEGNQLVLQIRLESYQHHSTMLQYYNSRQPPLCMALGSQCDKPNLLDL